MKKKALLGGIILGVIFTCSSINNASAQYTTALGVRVGGTTGLTLKHVFKQNIAVEGILGTFGNGFSITGLLEKQLGVGNVEGLHFYYGGGLHVASYDGSSYDHIGRDVQPRETKGFGFGLNGIAGLEYRLPNFIPIAFSIDTKPFVEVGTGDYVGFALDPSIAIKFVIQ